MKSRYRQAFFILFIFSLSLAYSKASILEGIRPSEDTEYIVRLTNGDMLTGYIVEMVDSTSANSGYGVKLRTELGKAIIYQSQIADIAIKGDYYRHSHRIFLQPTAEPIGDNFFVGIFELGFLYAGVGVGDWLSVTAGRSMLPGVTSRQQISAINMKITVYTERFEEMPATMSIALGGNLAYINDYNKLMHGYATISFHLTRSIITGTLFYKAGEDDYYLLNFGGNTIDLKYENGSFGIGAGIDTKFTSWHDLHFIGEIWNSSIAKPTNTAVLLGFRLSGRALSADFGMAFFTQPLVIPFVSFCWTPF